MAEFRSIPIELLRRIVRCDSDTGEIFWQPRPPEMFRSGYNSQEKSAKIFNTKFANKRAFRKHETGYFIGGILGKKHMAHRVIWALHYGEWPEGCIDHINGNPSDNRISNLRSVTYTGNQTNRAISKNNTSGIIGVRWRQDVKKWIAQIRVNGKNYHLGVHASRAAAIAARKAAEIKYGFHPNHGRAA